MATISKRERTSWLRRSTVREARTRLAKIPGVLLDVFAPPFCRGCGVPTASARAAYCAGCRADVEWIGHGCARCGAPIARADRSSRYGSFARLLGCADCRTRAGFARAASGALYSGTVRHAVLRFKYRGDRGVLPFLAEVASRAAERPWVRSAVSEAAGVVPVPQHWTRSIGRGWNPAQEVAERLAANLDLPVTELVRKVRRTQPQSALTGSARRTNLLRAFAVPSGRKVPRCVLLFDDVYTTGTTVAQCALALRRAGAQSVVVITIARSL